MHGIGGGHGREGEIKPARLAHAHHAPGEEGGGLRLAGAGGILDDRQRRPRRQVEIGNALLQGARRGNVEKTCVIATPGRGSGQKTGAGDGAPGARAGIFTPVGGGVDFRWFEREEGAVRPQPVRHHAQAGKPEGKALLEPLVADAGGAGRCKLAREVAHEGARGGQLGLAELLAVHVRKPRRFAVMAGHGGDDGSARLPEYFQPQCLQKLVAQRRLQGPEAGLRVVLVGNGPEWPKDSLGPEPGSLALKGGGELADVMQADEKGAEADESLLFLPQPFGHAAGLFAAGTQQYPGHGGHVHHVPRGGVPRVFIRHFFAALQSLSPEQAIVGCIPFRHPSSPGDLAMTALPAHIPCKRGGMP